MPEKGLKITIPENNPIQSLQNQLLDEEKTKVLLFGVPSLRVLSDDFSPKLLDEVIRVLSNFNPDVICLDATSPNEIISSFLVTGKSIELDLSKEDLDAIIRLRNKNKINFDAGEKVDSLLRLISNSPNSESKIREQLVEIFLSNFDLYSAALNFLYIKDNIKHKLDHRFANLLSSIIKQSDEKSSIGLRLAHKLKMNRVYSVGDISDKPMLDKISEHLYNEMILSDYYLSNKYEILNQVADRKLKEGLSKNNLLDFFLYINSDTYLINSTKNNWTIYYKMFLESGLDRTRIGLWEMKNLRIAANIREVSSIFPMKKILVIIDVAKKPFVEEYLKTMTDMKIMKFSEIIN
jgi:hypothetical protein